jgi:predicted HTH domain antitoxin
MAMRNTVEIECPPELLISLHVNAEQFGDRITREAAINLFKDGLISSGLAAHWLGIPRIEFLLDAMRHGATLLEDSDDDFRREAGLP